MAQETSIYRRSLQSYPVDGHDIPLGKIRGRPAGQPINSGGSPKWVGIVRENGTIRIDCENYPEAWMEIDIPEEIMQAWIEHRSRVPKENQELIGKILLGG